MDPISAILGLIGTATGLIGKFKEVGKLSKEEMNTLDESIRNIQINSNSIIAQNFELQGKLLAYEKQNKEYDDWKQIADTHVLVNIGEHKQVIVPIAYKNNPKEAPIWYCPVCFENKKRHPLDEHSDCGSYIVYHCSCKPDCNFKMELKTGKPSNRFTAGR
jgi:hypothetical protein